MRSSHSELGLPVLEALLQTQAAEVGCTALDQTSLIRNYSLLLNLENFERDFC